MQRSQQQPAPTPRAEDFAFSRLIAYAAYQWPAYRTAPHHRLIARKLEAVERGDIRRLVINVPPRHGKSMLVSEFFPAWYLGRNPDHYVAFATYAQELADDFGRKVKNQIADASFQAIFPGVGLADDSKSAKRFHIDGLAGGYETALTQRGAYYAVGIGGPLTGRGAHLLLIDDPIKNREDADSDKVRRKMRDWYTSTAYPRLMPGGRVVLIQTRWHEDDLSGWLLREHAHEGWEVLCLPAIGDDGAALWPEQYDLESLSRIRQSIGSRDWSALYQQQPVPREGGMFKRHWFKVVKAPPAERKRVRGWDLAATEKTSQNAPDWTASVLMSKDEHGRFFIEDAFRFQGSALSVEQSIDNTARLDGKATKVTIPKDPGQAGKAQAEALVRRLAGFDARVIAPTGAKEVRASPLSAQAEAGNVYLVEAPWNTEFLDELCTFPAGRNDDFVDAAADAFNTLAEKGGGGFMGVMTVGHR